MTTLHALANLLADARLSLDAAVAVTEDLAALPDGDVPLSPVEQARYLLRADRLADRVSALAEELAEVTRGLIQFRPREESP